MLVLSRQRDETIVIGDEIEITVVDIRGDKVRLGISAPRHVQVHRKEVYEAIKRENAEATQVNADDLKLADHNLRRLNGRGASSGALGPKPRLAQ
ncbi:MAG: carbon storage regulator CsrA [Phycisphaeraceae bacterium]